MISFTAAAVLARTRPSGLGARPAERDGRMDGRYVGASTPCFRPSGAAPRSVKLPCSGQSRSEGHSGAGQAQQLQRVEARHKDSSAARHA